MKNQVSSLQNGWQSRRTRDVDGGVLHDEEVYVLFTSIEDTLQAAAVGQALATRMRAQLTLMHLRVVPFRIPIDRPAGISPAQTADFVGALRTAASDARVKVVLCRDECKAIATAFSPHAVIVVAGRRSWWPTRLERRIRALEAAGHRVAFVDTSRRPCVPLPRTPVVATDRRLLAFPLPETEDSRA